MGPSKAWVLLVALTAIAACTHSSSHPGGRTTNDTSINARPIPTGWTVHTLGGEARFGTPAAWFSTPYRGEPATVYFPVLFLSSNRLTGPCAAPGAPAAACTGRHWFAASWSTPAHGVLILWSHAEFPFTAGPALSNLDGRPVVIAKRPAKLWTGRATDLCPDGAQSEIDAHIRISPHSRPGERFDMTACLGPQVTAANRQAVYTMLATLTIG